MVFEDMLLSPRRQSQKSVSMIPPYPGIHTVPLKTLCIYLRGWWAYDLWRMSLVSILSSRLHVRVVYRVMSLHTVERRRMFFLRYISLCSTSLTRPVLPGSVHCSAVPLYGIKYLQAWHNTRAAALQHHPILSYVSLLMLYLRFVSFRFVSSFIIL